MGKHGWIVGLLRDILEFAEARDLPITKRELLRVIPRIEVETGPDPRGHEYLQAVSRETAANNLDLAFQAHGRSGLHTE